MLRATQAGIAAAAGARIGATIPTSCALRQYRDKMSARWSAPRRASVTGPMGPTSHHLERTPAMQFCGDLRSLALDSRDRKVRRLSSPPGPLGARGQPSAPEPRRSRLFSRSISTAQTVLSRAWRAVSLCRVGSANSVHNSALSLIFLESASQDGSWRPYRRSCQRYESRCTFLLQAMIQLPFCEAMVPIRATLE